MSVPDTTSDQVPEDDAADQATPTNPDDDLDEQGTDTTAPLEAEADPVDYWEQHHPLPGPGDDDDAYEHTT